MTTNKYIRLSYEETCIGWARSATCNLLKISVGYDDGRLPISQCFSLFIGCQHDRHMCQDKALYELGKGRTVIKTSGERA